MPLLLFVAFAMIVIAIAHSKGVGIAAALALFTAGSLGTVALFLVWALSGVGAQ